MQETWVRSLSGRSPGEGNGNPLQYSCLKNPMDRGAWWDTVHGGRKESDTTERLQIKKNLKKYMRKVGGFLLFVFFALILLLIDYSIIILYFCEMLGLIQVHVLITHTWKLLVCIFAASLEISFTFTFTWLMFQKFCI